MGSTATADDPSPPTVLMTDIEDSTRLWEQNPDSMQAVVEGHNEIVASGVAAGGGRLVKSTGDGALALFANASNAVATAVAIQRALLERPWDGIGDVRVRIGLDTGVCRFVTGDVLGRPPNLASRLQSAGHGGQILVSGATAAACASDLADGIELREIGAYLVRGFDEPISIHMVLHEELPTAFPPLRASPVGVDDFPPDDGEFFGRDDLIVAVPAWLETHRVVTLWGAAGVGKSRIATRIGRTARRPYDDGVRFVDLSRSTSDDIERAVVAALHAQPVGDELATDTALRTLRPLRVLLVMLHCEPVRDLVRSFIDTVQQECPHVRVLATSREVLGCVGERPVLVRPLATPRHAWSPDDLLALPSVRLFLSRLTELQPTFRLHPSNAELVAEVCNATDGLPLALELAAARAGTEGLAAAPTVAASLAARVAEQIARLDAGDASLVAHLAVFDGVFSRDLAIAVAPDPDAAAAGLDRLARNALIQVEALEVDRFRLLNPCRHVAWNTLPTAAQHAVRSRHAAVMAERAAIYEPLLRTGGQADAVRALNSEFAEFRSAVEFLVAETAFGEAAALVTRLFQFCLFQPRPEGHRWAIDIAREVDAVDPHGMQVLGAAALGSWFAGDMTNAVDLGRRAVDIATPVGGSTVWARTALVNALGYVGDLDGVVPHFGALVRELRRSDDPYWQINGLGYEVISLSMFGRDADALAKAEHAIDLARELGNPDGLHWALYAFGRASTRDDPYGALEAYEQAMNAAFQVDSKFNVGLDLVEWIGIQRRLGESQLAARGASDLLDLVAVSGNRAQLSQAILETGLVLAHAGCAEPAALALLSRRGLPTMPTGAEDVEDAGCLARLAAELGTTWSRVRVRARALSEPDLVDLCRNTVASLASSPA